MKKAPRAFFYFSILAGHPNEQELIFKSGERGYKQCVSFSA